jgi:predicted dehydrogenase
MTIPSANQYTRMVEHFGECIIQSHPPRYPAEDSDKTMQVIDAAFESIRTGRPVRL